MHRQLTPRLAIGLAAALLGYFTPGIAWADLRFRALTEGNAYLAPLDDTPPGLPPTWHFNTATSGIDNFGDPTMAVTIDPMTGLVRESYHEQNVEIRDPLVTTGSDYNSLMTSRTTRRLWRDKFKQNRSISRTVPGRGGLFRVELPVQLPGAVRKILGNGAPSLEVSGSESITLAGKSDWIPGQKTVTSERKPQGAFPSFEMNQELNVNVTGTIGDKIKVDVDQSSNVQSSLDNKVKLRYEGDEDDMIKSVELGNTNLSLQGASIRQEGLFGVKTAMRLGNVDLVTIASKQEGKNETARFTPNGDPTPITIRDLEYIKHQYFVVADHPTFIDYNTLQVWRDDGNNSNNGDDVDLTSTNTPRGLARLDPTAPSDSVSNPQVLGRWDKLIQDVDYTIRDTYWPATPNGLRIPVIRLTNALGGAQMLAVSYIENATDTVGYGRASLELTNEALGKGRDTLLLKMIRPRDEYLKVTGINDFDSTSAWYPVLPYELRNFYFLGAQNISATSLDLKIRKWQFGEAVNPDKGADGVPLIETLGLDQVDAQGERNPDGHVDPAYLDVERGVLFFPDITPFDPTGWPGSGCGPDSTGFLCLNYTLRNTLRRDPVNPQDQTANPLVYYRYNPAIADSRYYIDANVRSSRQGYFLGRFNVLEGSEQVRVNGIAWSRGTDYTIDYDTGQITFLKSPPADASVTVDYSFAPGAGQVQRTLAGFSLGYSPSVDRSFSSSFLYESKGAQEELVKLGEEPATSMIGDLSTVLTFRPAWMTQFANVVPGVHTSTQSSLNLQGSLSTSIPNPNTKGEAYIDDMEGNKESNSVGLSRGQWQWSSVPLGKQSILADHAWTEWYNPANAVKEEDLKPVLTKQEGGENNHQVLELNLIPPDSSSGMGIEDWGGVTQVIATVGQDLTRVQYLEIWVNDFQHDHSTTPGRLHFDFGRMDEDAFWDRRNPPNGLLDTEDKNKDGHLDRPGDVDKRDDPRWEDTGLDGLVDWQEPGYDPNSNPDPDGDDYTYNASSAPNDYSTINNSEKNGLLNDPNARPDTEDLNRDEILERENNYFETTIVLSDTAHVAIDVPKLYAGQSNLREFNGWRLYRIPLSDSVFTKIGSPSWFNIQSLRVWADSMTTPLRLQIGGIDLIGSTWLRQAFRDSTYRMRGVEFEVRTRNNKDDAGIYLPPYQVKDAVGINAARREQSLALGYKNLAIGDSVFAFKTLGNEEGGVGWAQYQGLRFYVHGDLGVEAESLRLVARFGPDTVNYYEYSMPVREGWQSVVIPMEKLSGLKERRAGQQFFVDRETGAADGSGEVFAVAGNPSFTRVTRTSFGLTVAGTPLVPTIGEVWIDELRLSDVRKDRGVSSHAVMQANFADLMSLNASFDKQDKDYFRVGQGASLGSGFDHTAIGLSSTLYLDKLAPRSGLTVPVSVSLQHSTDVPKFRTGSDVILGGDRSSIETREFNRQSITTSYRRNGPRTGVTRYTLDALSGGMSYGHEGSISPQSVDSSWAFNANAGYAIPIGGKGFHLGPIQMNPLPRTIDLSTTWTSSRSVNYARSLNDTADVQELRSDFKRRDLGLRMVTSLEPLSAVRLAYTLESTRDMLQHQAGGLFGTNKGTEIAHSQLVTLNYRPKWMGLILPTGINMSGTYSERASSDRRGGVDPQNLKDITNSGSVRTNLVVPVARLGGRRHLKADTTGTFSLLAPLRFFLSKVTDISTTLSMDRSTGLTRVTGDPGRAFKSGFTQVFQTSEITPSLNTAFQTSRRYSAGGNSSFHPIERLTVDVRGDYQLSFTDSYGARRTMGYVWPEVTTRWSDLQRTLGLGETLSSLTLSSTYRQRTDESGPKGGLVEQRLENMSISPLLGWEAVFRNGIRLSASSHVDRTRTSNDEVLDYFQERRSKGSTIRFNKTFPASQGIKFPWNKKRVKLPNDLNLGGSVDLSSDKTILHQRGSEYPQSDFDALTIQSQNSYNFSQAMSGGFNLEFRQNVDRKSSVTRRGLTIAFNGTLRF